jgi:hypothetical protein
MLASFIRDLLIASLLLMLKRFCLLSVIMAAVFTTAAVAGEDEARPDEVPGWGRVLDPSRDCNVSVNLEHDRLEIKVPGTPSS